MVKSYLENQLLARMIFFQDIEMVTYITFYTLISANPFTFCGHLSITINPFYRFRLLLLSSHQPLGWH